MRLILILLSGLQLVSCSGGSGSWDDDVQNWGRAFEGQVQPSDVKVVHSRFWKSPHFTSETEFFFEFTAPEKYVEAWIAGQKLVPTPPSAKNTPTYFSKPAWFTPKALGEYELWLPGDEPHSKFRLYRDRTTGILFVTDCST